MILWFGDSYTVGSELTFEHSESVDAQSKLFFKDRICVERNRPDFAFTTLTSNKLNEDFLILGSSYKSIQGMEIDLVDYIKQGVAPNATAIFCFPTQYKRCDYIDYKKNLIRGKGDKHILRHQARFSEFETTFTINSIYSMCITHNIKPYFISLWSSLDLMPEYSIVPDDVWLLPYNRTLVEEAWDFTDPPETWRTLFKSNNYIYNTYIKPCGNHPNTLGHEKLSSTLYNLLTKK
jgi:hypothetical protein